MTSLVYSTPNGKEEGESPIGVNQEYCQPGAFGSYIDKEKAMILGRFPDCDLANIYAVGNAAGDRARIALLNRDKRGEAEEIACKIEYMELTIEEDFQTEFIEALQIPHMRDPFPHLKNIIREEILLQ